MTPTIDVSDDTYERFEEERAKTKSDHLPEMSQNRFVQSLLDTAVAAREGYYDDE